MLKMIYKELVLRTYMPPQQFTGIVYLSDDMNPYEVISKWNNQQLSSESDKGPAENSLLRIESVQSCK